MLRIANIITRKSSVKSSFNSITNESCTFVVAVYIPINHLSWLSTCQKTLNAVWNRNKRTSRGRRRNEIIWALEHPTCAQRKTMNYLKEDKKVNFTPDSFNINLLIQKRATDLTSYTEWKKKVLNSLQFRFSFLIIKKFSWNSFHIFWQQLARKSNWNNAHEKKFHPKMNCMYKCLEKSTFCTFPWIHFLLTHFTCLMILKCRVFRRNCWKIFEFICAFWGAFLRKKFQNSLKLEWSRNIHEK